MRNKGLATVMLMMLFFEATPQALAVRQQSSNRPPADIGAFVKELMAVKIDGTRTQLAIWFPYEFFIEAALSQPGSTRAGVEQDVGFMKPYITMIIQCKFENPDGSGLYASEAEVRARAALKMADGTEVSPIDRTPPKIAAMVSALKTIISAEGDAGSANMHILVFPTQNKQGKLIVNTSQKDKLALVLKADRRYPETIFAWHTPFDATANVTMCSRCKEQVSPKWTYCPWCGQKISNN
jgi:hypothetical protein